MFRSLGAELQARAQSTGQFVSLGSGGEVAAEMTKLEAIGYLQKIVHKITLVAAHGAGTRE